MTHRRSARRVVRFHETGGPDVLRVVDQSPESPGPDEVRVLIRAAGLNRAEWLLMHGMYLVQPTLPSRIGVEAAGIIDAVGPGVDDFKPGDEVNITPNLDPSRYGVLGDWTVVPRSSLLKKPATVDFETAAAVWMAFATAYGGLMNAGGLKAGQTVLVTAASSSVGLAAIQVAKHAGATVIATSRGESKLGAIEAAGADCAVAATSETIANMIESSTNGRKIDVVFDPIAGSMLPGVLPAVAPEGRIVLYGALGLQPTPLPLFDLIAKGITVAGFHVVYHLLQHTERWASAHAAIEAGISSGAYRPVIDSRFELNEVADAYRRLESNEQVGKILVIPNGG